MLPKLAYLKNYCFVCLFFSATFVGFGQEKFKVIYDYSTEKITYLKLDKAQRVVDTLIKPRIKRNSLVEISVQNINPFAVNVETAVSKEAIHQTAKGLNFTSLIGGIGRFSDSKMKLNIKSLPDNMFTAMNESSRGELMQSKLAQLNDLVTSVAAMKSTLIADLINPNLTKQAILEHLYTIAETPRDVRLSNPRTNFFLYLSNLERIASMETQLLSSTSLAMMDEIITKGRLDSTQTRGAFIERQASIEQLQLMNQTLEASAAQTIGHLDKLKELYTLLNAASFENTYDYVVDADQVNVALTFVQSDFSEALDNDDAKAVLKVRNVKLLAKGGFKINTSVALTLNNFSSSSKDFFIGDDGVIGADDNNYYVPNLSTMINFYPMLGENFNIGGTFGVSIPIANDGGGLSFLLGPSIFIGNKSRLAFSGGVAYGPVKQLRNGLLIGDTTTSRDVDDFTKTVYDFGYFFGISFSLFDVN